MLGEYNAVMFEKGDFLFDLHINFAKVFDESEG